MSLLKYNEIPREDDGVCLSSITAVYRQAIADPSTVDEVTCEVGWEELEIKTQDVGAGPFYAISTRCWTCNDAAELTALLDDFTARCGINADTQ